MRRRRRGTTRTRPQRPVNATTDHDATRDRLTAAALVCQTLSTTPTDFRRCSFTTTNRDAVNLPVRAHGALHLPPSLLRRHTLTSFHRCFQTCFL